MKVLLKIMVLLLAVLQLNVAMANEDITGLWQGKLVVSPDTELVIQFNISQGADGSYTAVLNTPDGGSVENVEADSVVFDAGKIKMGVAELSGSYEGIFKEGKIDGEWKQEGTSFPLSLKPYEKPTLSKEDMEMLLGEWRGKPVLPEGAVISINGETDITYSFKFEMSEQGEFTGISSFADMGMPGEPLSDMGISDGIFTFKMGKMEKFKGKLTDEKIVGEIKMVGDANLPGISLTLVKGEYKAPVYNLNLNEETMEKLQGKWNGKLNNLDVIFRFAKEKSGDFRGFVSIPKQGPNEMPIMDASLNEGELTLKIKAAMPAEFVGELSANKLVGDWNAMTGESTPLTLDKETVQ